MYNKPKTCMGCPLGPTDGGWSIPEGIDVKKGVALPGFNGVLIIGEALGEQERRFGTPFVVSAEAGSTLHQALRQLGIKRENFALYNLVACRPPNNVLAGRKEEAKIVDHCSIYLNNVVEMCKPKVILALGNLPLKYLTEMSGISKLPKRAAPYTIEELSVQKQSITDVRGYRLFSKKYNCHVVASLHPAFVTRMDRIYLDVLARDIQFAVDLAANKIDLDFKYDYTINPTAEWLEAYIKTLENTPEEAVAYDIETPNTALEADETNVDYEVRDIDSIQFSHAEGKALYLTWNEFNTPYVRRIFKTKNPKIGWYNWKFDSPILGYHLGQDFLNGENIDVMTLWKHYHPDFKEVGNALQFAANFACSNFPVWKHLAQEQPEFYGCLDVDATKRVFNWLLKKCDKKFTSVLGTGKAEYKKFYNNILEGWFNDIRNIKPILDKMSARGLPIDIEKMAAFDTKIVTNMGEVLQQLQEVYPKHLLNVKQAEGLKRIPKEVPLLRTEFEKQLNPHNDAYRIYKDESYAWFQFLEKNTRVKAGLSGLVLKEFKDPQFDTPIRRYCRVLDFKPLSSPQTLAYIQFMGYKMPKGLAKKKKKGEESTAKDVLFKMAEIYKDDKFFPRVVAYRELKKLKSTYVDGWVKYLDENNYIHSKFSVGNKKNPATGQFSSSEPNVMNAPARGSQFSSPGYKELAIEFKSTLSAREGKTLIECDYSSFHALTLGFEAEDEDYIKLVRADVHGYLAAHLAKARASGLAKEAASKGQKLNEVLQVILDYTKGIEDWLKLSIPDLKAKIKWMRKEIEYFQFIRDSQAKPAILGMGFGMGVNKFYKLNEENFENKDAALLVFNLIHELFPKLFIYQDKVKRLAHEQGYLVSRTGYIRHFFHVYDTRILREWREPTANEKINKDEEGRVWITGPGEQAESAIAFFPANDAFGKKKEAMRELEETGANEKYGLINDMHDAFVFHCPNEFVDEACAIIKEIMEKPSKVLINKVAPEGLACLTETKIGKNWGAMEDYVRTISH